MKKAYLFVYNDTVGTRDQVKTILDAMPEVITWRYDLPNCFYVISYDSAHTVSEAFRSRHGDTGLWIFVEVADNKQGWMQKRTWHLLNNKEHLP